MIMLNPTHSVRTNSPVLTGYSIFPGEPFTWENQPEPVNWQQAIEVARNYDPLVDRYRHRCDTNISYSTKKDEERKYRRVNKMLVRKSIKYHESNDFNS